jgi:hypothetical protein
LASVIVPLVVKVIVFPAPALAAVIAERRDPDPESASVDTVYVVADAETMVMMPTTIPAMIECFFMVKVW